jgi:hypothetical protein
MKPFILLVIPVAMLLGNSASAKTAIAHMYLKDHRNISGYILYVGDSAIVIQEDLERFEYGLHTSADTMAIKENATLVRYADILYFELERFSNAWMLGNIGVGLFFGFLYAYTDSEYSGRDKEKMSILVGIFTGLTIGSLAALVVHSVTSADLQILIHDPDDIELLKGYALFQDSSMNDFRLKE